MKKTMVAALPLTVVLTLGAVVLAGCGNGDAGGDSPQGSASTAAPETGVDETTPPEEETQPSSTSTDAPIGGETEPPLPPEPELIELPIAVEVFEDLAYTSERSLDVYAPTEGSDWPVVVYFHGGVPVPGFRQAAAATLRAIAESGVVVYAPDWNSFGPSGGSQDSICAVAYAEATAGDHGGRPEFMTLAGYSTGAFTAAIHGLVGDEPPLEVTDCVVDPVMSSPDAVAVGGAPFFATECARAGLLPAPAWSSLTLGPRHGPHSARVRLRGSPR